MQLTYVVRWKTRSPKTWLCLRWILSNELMHTWNFIARYIYDVYYVYVSQKEIFRKRDTHFVQAINLEMLYPVSLDSLDSPLHKTNL